MALSLSKSDRIYNCFRVLQRLHVSFSCSERVKTDNRPILSDHQYLCYSDIHRDYRQTSVRHKQLAPDRETMEDFVTNRDVQKVIIA